MMTNKEFLRYIAFAVILLSTVAFLMLSILRGNSVLAMSDTIEQFAGDGILLDAFLLNDGIATLTWDMDDSGARVTLWVSEDGGYPYTLRQKINRRDMPDMVLTVASGNRIAAVLYWEGERQVDGESVAFEWVLQGHVVVGIDDSRRIYLPKVEK